jgi:hypothetical protein
MLLQKKKKCKNKQNCKYLFPAVTSTAVKNLSSQSSNSIIGPNTPRISYSLQMYLTVFIPLLTSCVVFSGIKNCEDRYNTALMKELCSRQRIFDHPTIKKRQFRERRKKMFMINPLNKDPR